MGIYCHEIILGKGGSCGKVQCWLCMAIEEGGEGLQVKIAMKLKMPPEFMTSLQIFKCSKVELPSPTACAAHMCTNANAWIVKQKQVNLSWLL